MFFAPAFQLFKLCVVVLMVPHKSQHVVVVVVAVVCD